VGALTGWRVLRLKHSERQSLYKQVWIEYGLRAVLGSAAVTLLIIWTVQKSLADDVLKYAKEFDFGYKEKSET